MACTPDSRLAILHTSGSYFLLFWLSGCAFIWFRLFYWRHQVPAAVHLPASSSSTRIFKFRLSSPVPRQCTVELGHAGVVPVARYLIVLFTVVCLAHLQVLSWRCVWTMSRWTRSTIHCCVIVWLYCIVMPNWVFPGLGHPRDPPGHDIGLCHCSGRGSCKQKDFPYPLNISHTTPLNLSPLFPH